MYACVTPAAGAQHSPCADGADGSPRNTARCVPPPRSCASPCPRAIVHVCGCLCVQARAEVAAPSASLRSPKRPFTPAEAGRALFFSDDYRAGQRPSTAVSSGDLMATPRLGLSLRSSSFGLGEGPERGGRPPRADSFSATASLEVGGKEEASALTWGWADGEGEGEGGAPDRPSCPEHYGAISDACDKVNPVTEALVPLKEGDEEGAGAIAATLGEVESGVIALAAAMATAGVGPETRADSLVDALSMLPPWIAKGA